MVGHEKFQCYTRWAGGLAKPQAVVALGTQGYRILGRNTADLPHNPILILYVEELPSPKAEKVSPRQRVAQPSSS